MTGQIDMVGSTAVRQLYICKHSTLLYVSPMVVRNSADSVILFALTS